MRGNSSISAINSPSRIGLPVNLILPAATASGKRRLLGDHLVERAARQREAGVGLGRLRARDIGQRAVLQVENEGLAGIGKTPVQHDVLAFGLRAVEPDAEHVP